jgi:hypothetical protein
VTHPHRYAVRLRLASSAALALAALLAGPATWTTTVGQTPSPTGATLIRVEEDWSLSVSQPDANLAAPQVSTQMARAPWSSRFCNLHLNSTDLPAFAVGGLQVQAWHNAQNISVLTSPDAAIMATDNELVTWTQYLRVNAGTVYFGIGTVQPGVAGASSQTWGDFSGMEIPVPGNTADLSNYDPSYSQQNSGVTFGATRVSSLVLVQVRYYYSDGSVRTDSTPRVVYSGALGP